MTTNYRMLERLVSKELRLGKDSFYILNYNQSFAILEFVYPINSTGNMFSIDLKNHLTEAFISNKPYICNDFSKEKSSYAISLLFDRGNSPVQKKIIFPVADNGTVSKLFVIMRKAASVAEAGPDFDSNDLHKIQSILKDMSVEQVAQAV